MSCPVPCLYLAVLKMPDDSLALAASPGVPMEERLMRKIHAAQLLAAMLTAELSELPASDPLGAVAAAAGELVSKCRVFKAAALAETLRLRAQEAGGRS
jgi:hypothetical protein